MDVDVDVDVDVVGRLSVPDWLQASPCCCCRTCYGAVVGRWSLALVGTWNRSCLRFLALARCPLARCPLPPARYLICLALLYLPRLLACSVVYVVAASSLNERKNDNVVVAVVNVTRER